MVPGQSGGDNTLGEDKKEDGEDEKTPAVKKADAVVKTVTGLLKGKCSLYMKREQLKMCQTTLSYIFMYYYQS